MALTLTNYFCLFFVVLLFFFQIVEPFLTSCRQRSKVLGQAIGAVRSEMGAALPAGDADVRQESVTVGPISIASTFGGGKSTAIALIPRLHDATTGAVTIDGADVRDTTLGSLRDAIAFAPGLHLCLTCGVVYHAVLRGR